MQEVVTVSVELFRQRADIPSGETSWTREHICGGGTSTRRILPAIMVINDSYNMKYSQYSTDGIWV